MKNIYLVSYIGGMYGEFISNLIAKDENFYSSKRTYTDATINRHVYWSVIDDIIEFLIPTEFPKISEEQKKIVDDIFNEKHIVVRTHTYLENPSIEWSRLKLVKFYAGESEWLYTLLLEIAKSLIQTYGNFPSAGPEVNDAFIEKMTGYLISLGKPKEITENVRNIKIFKVHMALQNTTSIEEYIDCKMLSHRELSTINSGGDWSYLNPRQLLLNPEQHVKEWQTFFDLSEPFDIDAIKNYQATNDKLILDTFGKTYNEIFAGNYRQFLIDFFTKIY